MTSKRLRLAGIAATAISIPFFLPAIAGADVGAANGTVGSSDDPNSYPPYTLECAGQLWYQSVNEPYSEALSASNSRMRLWDIAMTEAGTVTVSNVATWDNRSNQEGLGDPEPFETMTVEFWNDGVFVGTAPLHSPDLPDDGTYAWANSDLGSFDLPHAANEVYLVHSSEFTETDGGENAFFPKTVCISTAPFAPEPVAAVLYDCESALIGYANEGTGWVEFTSTIDDTTEVFDLGAGEFLLEALPLVEDSTTTILVTVPGAEGPEVLLDETIVTDCEQPTTTTTTPPTTTPPTTVTPTTVAPTVLAQVETAPVLAFTGDESGRNTAIGAVMLAAGAGLLAVSRRRRPIEA